MLEKLENESLGKYIERIRIYRGYSQRKLASVTGISNTTINRIENGETLNPDSPTLTSIAKALKIDEEYILRVAGYINTINNPVNSDMTKDKENDELIDALTSEQIIDAALLRLKAKCEREGVPFNPLDIIGKVSSSLKKLSEIEKE